jgi:hypothetical protein
VRETWNYFEADIRDGELVAVTCTATDGYFSTGHDALERLIAVGSGRFSVTEAKDTPKRQFEEGTTAAIARACERLNRSVAQVIDGALLSIAQVELDEEILDLYSQVMPPKLRLPLELLRGGDSPREIILAGTASPDALETLLLDLIRVGAVINIMAPPPDLSRTPVSRDSARWRALGEGELTAEDDEPGDRPIVVESTRSARTTPMPRAAPREERPSPRPARRASTPALPPLAPERDERLVSRSWQVLALIALVALGLSLYLTFRMWQQVPTEAPQVALEPAPEPEPVETVPPPEPEPEPEPGPPAPPAVESPAPAPTPPEPATAPEETVPEWKKKKKKKKGWAGDEPQPPTAETAPPAVAEDSPYGGPTEVKKKVEEIKKTIEETKKKQPPEEKPAPAPQPAAEKGKLVISAPASAPGPIKVAVDGKPRGTAPLQVELKPGLHEVTFSVGGKRSLRMVSIKAGKTKSITAKVPE